MDKLIACEKRKFDIAYRKKIVRGHDTKLSKIISVIHSYEIADGIFPEDLTSPEAIEIAKTIVESHNNDMVTFVFVGIVIREDMLHRHYYGGYDPDLI